MFRPLLPLVLSFGICLNAIAISSAPAPSSSLQQFGRVLFFDKSLSSDGTVSCATCHKPDHAFSDGQKVAVGVGKRAGTRNTPSLLDLGQGPFFWDGRAATLDDLVLQPFLNPMEMGLHDHRELVSRVVRSMAERAMFQKAFPQSAASSPKPDQISQALTAYLRSIPNQRSAYDLYVSSESKSLSPDAQKGLTLFTGAARCAECHRLTGSPTAFTDDQFHSTLINPLVTTQLPDRALRIAHSPPASASLGVEIASDAVISELGRYMVSLDPKDIGAFRTPSLRNVALTAPYMHDGSATTLRDAVDREIYYRSLQRNEPNTLTEQDRQDLVAFLGSLTDIR